MSGVYTAIDHLYIYDDGDTITPGMGVKWVNGETGFGLQQYFNETTGKVVATDFAQHPVLLFPQPYSTSAGAIVKPETEGQQWYYGNISTDGGILENGKVKDAYKDRFEVAEVEMNGMKFPALKIKGNLATAENHTDKRIYYQSSYNGRAFVCDQLIPIQATAGDSITVLISVTGENGSGDNVLSNDQDWIKYTANLQRSGVPITDQMDYEWQQMINGRWVVINSVEKILEVADNVLTAYNAGVEGMEMFRVKITYNKVVYYGTCEATDIHDPYYIEPGRSKATREVGRGERITYTPRVYDRSTGKESTGWTFTFTFTDYKGEVRTDITKDTITYDNIKEKGGGSIATRIEARKSA